MTQMCLSLDSDLVWPFYTFLNKPHMKKSVRNHRYIVPSSLNEGLAY